MFLRSAKARPVPSAGTVLRVCENCGNQTAYELVSAKTGIGIGIPVVQWFTDKAVLAQKSYYLRCPVCSAGFRVEKDLARGLMNQGR
jgi:hypothetical protein